MAQQVVTELVINADTAGADKFSQAMASAEQAANSGVSAVSDFSTGLLAIGGGAAAAVLGIKGMLDQVVSANKGLADMQTVAHQVGLTLTDFQSVQFGGAIKGLDTSQINSGLEKSASLLNDASRNSNSLSKELEANGLSVKNANGQLITENQLLGIAANLVKNAANPGDQIAIAQMLGFTKEWIPLLEQGAGAMSGLAAEAKAAGAIIDDETIGRATQFDSEWRKSSVEFSTYMKAALADLLPLLDDLIDKAFKFVKTIDRDKIEQASQQQLSGLAGQAGFDANNDEIRIGITDDAKKALEDFRNATSLWGGIVAGVSALTGSVQRIPRTYPEGSDPMAGGGKSSGPNNIDDVLKNWDKQQDAAQDAAGGHSVVASKDVAGDAVDRAINSLQKHTQAQIADAQAVGLGDAALAGFRAAAAETAAVLANGGKETDAQADKFSDLKDAAIAAADALAKAKVAASISFGQQTSFLSSSDVAIANQLKGIYGNDIPAAMASTEAAAIRTNNAIRGVSSAIETNLTSGLTDIAMGTKTAAQGFKDMSTAVIRALEEMIIKAMVVKPIMDSLQSSIGGSGILSFLGIGGGSGSAAQATSAATLSGNTGGAFYGPGFADGTTSAPGGWSLVGERGPELMKLPQGTQILPNGRSPSNDNGGTTVHTGDTYITVNGNADDNAMAQFKQEIAQLKAEIPARAVEAINIAKKQRRA